MELKEIIKLVNKTEKELGWTNTTKAQIIKFIKKDAKELKESNIKNKSIDLIVELIQLIKRTSIKPENEIKKHLTEMKNKYEKRLKSIT